jgi:F-type H+-transporting ATPase subunit b
MRWTIALSGLLAVGLLAGPGAAPSAAADPPAGGAHGAPAGEHKAFSIFPSTADLGLWSLVVFLILLFVLWKWAWGPILEGLQKREGSIRGALDEATKARDEAHTLRAQLQQEMGQAHVKVREIIDEARRDAQVMREEELAKAKAEIQGERDRLRREIEAETDQALQRIWASAADLATQASAKALGRSLDGESHRRLIDEALADLQSAANRSNGNA